MLRSLFQRAPDKRSERMTRAFKRLEEAACEHHAECVKKLTPPAQPVVKREVKRGQEEGEGKVQPQGLGAA